MRNLLILGLILGLTLLVPPLPPDVLKQLQPWLPGSPAWGNLTAKEAVDLGEQLGFSGFQVYVIEDVEPNAAYMAWGDWNDPRPSILLLGLERVSHEAAVGAFLHELGHYHQFLTGTYDYTDPRLMEWEADYFSMALGDRIGLNPWHQWFDWWAYHLRNGYDGSEDPGHGTIWQRFGYAMNKYQTLNAPKSEAL